MLLAATELVEHLSKGDFLLLYAAEGLFMCEAS